MDPISLPVDGGGGILPIDSIPDVVIGDVGYNFSAVRNPIPGAQILVPGLTNQASSILGNVLPGPLGAVVPFVEPYIREGIENLLSTPVRLGTDTATQAMLNTAPANMNNLNFAGVTGATPGLDRLFNSTQPGQVTELFSGAATNPALFGGGFTGGISRLPSFGGGGSMAGGIDNIGGLGTGGFTGTTTGPTLPGIGDGAGGGAFTSAIGSMGMSMGISMGMSLIGSLFGGSFSANTTVANRIVRSVAKTNRSIQESGKHLALVIASQASDYGEGNAFIVDHGRRQFNSHEFRVNTSTAMVVDSPFINFLSTQVLTQTRFYHLHADLYQATHLNTWSRVEEMSTQITKLSNRYNLVGVRETSSEAEYVAGTMYVYGDTIMTQAGQKNGKNITKDVKTDLDDKIIGQGSTYGTSINIALENYGILAEKGNVMVQAGRFIAMDAMMIWINCGMAGLKGAVPFKPQNAIKAPDPIEKVTAKPPGSAIANTIHPPSPGGTSRPSYSDSNSSTILGKHIVGGKS
jgi:hypothetical protein